MDNLDSSVRPQPAELKPSDQQPEWFKDVSVLFRSEKLNDFRREVCRILGKGDDRLVPSYAELSPSDAYGNREKVVKTKYGIPLETVKNPWEEFPEAEGGDPPLEVVALSSCTASPLYEYDIRYLYFYSPPGLKQLRELFDKYSSSYSKDILEDFRLLAVSRRRDYLRAAGIDENVISCAASSGTDSEYLASLISSALAGKAGKKSLAILLDSLTGSSTNLAAEGSHISEVSRFGKTRENSQDKHVEGFPEVQTVMMSPLSGEGKLKQPEQVRGEVMAEIEKAVGSGSVPNVRLVVDTKLGTEFGFDMELSFIKAIRKQYGTDDVVITIDNNQGRLHSFMINTLVKDYGCIVEDSLSKAHGAPPFAGLVYIPDAYKDTLNNADWPSGLNSYFSQDDFDPRLETLMGKVSQTVPNIPFFLKQEIAIDLAKRFNRLFPVNDPASAGKLTRIVRNVNEFVSGFRGLVEGRANSLRVGSPVGGVFTGERFKIMPANTDMQSAKIANIKFAEGLKDRYELQLLLHEFTIIPIQVLDRNSREFLDKKKMAVLCRLLGADLSAFPGKDYKEPMKSRFLVGQPVELGNDAFFRIAIGDRAALDVFESMGGMFDGWQSGKIMNEYYDNLVRLRNKIIYIVDNWDAVVEYYDKEVFEKV